MHALTTINADPLRPDAWSASGTHCRARYRLLAEREPDLLCRVLNLFAMQYLIPHDVSVARQEGLLMLEIEVEALTWHRAQVIGEKMRNLISVCSVDVQRVGDLHLVPEPVSQAAG